MSNYDKLYKVLSAWYTPDQINEIWAMLKDYDRKIHKKYLERQAASSKLDTGPGIQQDGIMKDIKKKLVKQVKRSWPSLAQEIKDMPMKDFRALWFVVQQGLKVKNKH